MSTFLHKKNPSKSRGQTLIEYTFIIPVFLMFICLTFELCFLFITSQRVGALSRDLAGTGYRECGSLTDDAIQTCLDARCEDVIKAAGLLLPNFPRGDCSAAAASGSRSNSNRPDGLKLAVWRKLVGGNGGVNNDDNMDLTGLGNIRSQFSPMEPRNWLVLRASTISVGEVAYSYEAITPFGQILWQAFFPDGRIYLHEKTVY